jgi:hypothetical protein
MACVCPRQIVHLVMVETRFIASNRDDAGRWSGVNAPGPLLVA